MDRTTVLQEVRIMRFEDVYGGFQVGRLGCEEAAELLGVSVSALYRYRRRFEAEGAEGLYDRRLGRGKGKKGTFYFNWLNRFVAHRTGRVPSSK